VKLLVTGGSGFIASRVVHQLAACPGVDVTVLVRAGSDLGRLTAAGVDLNAGNVRLARGDFSASDEVDQVIHQLRPEVVVHLAMVYHALGSTPTSAVEEVNLHATVRLLEAFLAAGGRRFITAGTCFEYGHQQTELLEETAACCPVYDYAIAKLKATEVILERSQAVAAEALVLRVFAPYGPHEDPRRVIPQLLATGLWPRRLALSPGEQVRDYVFVDDVARAFVPAAVQPDLARSQAVYNVCTGIGHSLHEVAAAVEQALGRRLDLGWGELPYRPNEMMRLVGANRRIAEDLGWAPARNLAEGLRNTAAWMRSNLVDGAAQSQAA